MENILYLCKNFRHNNQTLIMIFYGILLGIVLSLFFNFGPAFFSLLQTSVHYGFRRSVPFTFGVSLADICMVLLLLTVLSGIDMTELLHNPYVIIIGSAVIFTFGIYTFTRVVEQNADEKGKVIKFRATDAPKWYFVGLRGFLINIFNPMIWIYWISVISVVSGILDVDTADVQLLSFFIGLLASALGIDILKCRLASLLQHVLTANVINIINKISGLILIVFAAYMVASMVMYRTHPRPEVGNNSTVLIQRIMDGKDTTHTRIPETTAVLPDVME